MSRFLLILGFYVALGIRMDQTLEVSEPAPVCEAWYTAWKKSWWSKKYLKANPDPCLPSGLECCKGKCSVKGCGKDLRCGACKSLLEDVPMPMKQEICLDKSICNQIFQGCAFLGGACENRRQPCNECNTFYDASERGEACTDPHRCYQPANYRVGHRPCTWKEEEKKCAWSED